MTLKMFQVDAFTDQLFSGNPAAVFYLDEFPDETLMQLLAMENNLAETAFVVGKGASLRLRWFTPKSEVAFCGHATLATAHVLFTEYGFNGPLSFETAHVGTLNVSVKDTNFYQLDLPRLTPSVVDSHDIGTIDAKPVCVFHNFENLFFELEDEQAVRNFIPDLPAISLLEEGGLAITARANQSTGIDFVSRYFAPKAGISEDPVTGSTHSTLVPYWADKLQKTELTAQQCSERGGLLQCTLTDKRVLLAGKAVTFMAADVRVYESPSASSECI